MTNNPSNQTPPNWRMIVAATGVAIIIGSISPWATVSAGFTSLTVNGFQGDGQITLFLGILVLAGGVLGNYIISALAGLVAAGVGAYAAFNMTERAGAIDPDLTASIAWGLVLTIVASLLAFSLAVNAHKANRPAPVAGRVSPGPASPGPASSGPAPAWLADPTGLFQRRYWDGVRWTDAVANDETVNADLPPAV